jgi:hypothetical protein
VYMYIDYITRRQQKIPWMYARILNRAVNMLKI